MHILPKLILTLSLILSSGCNIYKPVDARKVSPTGTERAKKNIEEGRSVGLIGQVTGRSKGGSFEFANANELWRASLDVIDFMPLTSVNYSGGVITTDWYSDQGNTNESIKITIKFLSNEIRSDSLDVDVFYKTCIATNNCKINKQEGQVKKEITKQILAKAAIYKKKVKDK